MSCRKGKSDVKKREASFKCKKCDAYVEKKSRACKPKKLKKD
jgi:hypothetical protein